MQLELLLENIGPIKRGVLPLRSLTFIGGKNATGKSVASRLLYSSLSALVEYPDFWEEQIEKMLRLTEVWSYEHRKYRDIIRKIRTKLKTLKPLLKSWLREEADIKDDIKAQGEELFRYFQEIPLRNLLSYEFAKKFKEHFFSIFEDNKKLILETLGAILYEEFLDLKNVVKFGSSHGGFSLKNGNAKLLDTVLTSEGNLDAKIYLDKNNHLLVDEIIYLEGSYLSLLPIGRLIIILSLSDNRDKTIYMPRHLERLMKYFLRLDFEMDPVTENVYKKLLQEMEKLMKGKLIFEEDEVVFKGEEGVIPIYNLAGGVRSLSALHYILKLALSRSIAIIFDEPETNLHPEWQVLLCKFLLNIVRFGIPIVISTHSPYILQGIRRYSEEFEVKVDYILAVKESDGVVFQDVSDKPNSIMRELSRPFIRMVWG